MKALFPLELRRLLQSRLFLFLSLITVVSPTAGLILYKPADASTMLSMYLANPALAGGVAGGILFGLLTIFELDRGNRSRVNVLLDAVVSPLTMAMVRLLALLAGAVVTLLVTMAVWLPISMLLIGSVFGWADYCLSYLILMGLALPLGILTAASAYQFTQRADLSVILLAAFAGLSLSVWKDNWLLCWLNPCVWALSDDFSNFRIFRSAGYMRMCWLIALAGVWTVSWLCIRQYGKGLLGSLGHSIRRVYRPSIALALLILAGTAFAAQPIIDRSNPDYSVHSFREYDYLRDVFCLQRTAQVFPDTASGTLSGRTVMEFQNTSGKIQTVAFGFNPGYAISSVQVNGSDVPFTVGQYQEYNEALLAAALPAGEDLEMVVEYSGYPQENRNVSTMQGGHEISREYLCLENGTTAPYPLNVVTMSNTIEITMPASMTLIPFGAGQAEIVSEQADGNVLWRYETNSSRNILYAGDYVRQDIQAGGIDIQFYYGRKHQTIMEDAGAADAVKAVVDYCTEHYGSLAALGVRDSLKLIQTRVRSGGYAAKGASTLDEPNFTAANLNDSTKGGAPGQVMIHELVHQWWGLGKMFDEPQDSPWSSEGLTVYTTYRIVKALWGENYAVEHYVNRWQNRVDDYYLNFYVRNPEWLAALPENRQLRISNSLREVRQYSEMPLKLLKAETLVGGEEKMDAILRELFTSPGDYLTYEDFLNACGLKEADLNLG